MEHGFITYPTYKIVDGEPLVQLYGRLENGDTFRADIPYTPHFFIKTADLERAKELTELDAHETSLETMRKEPATRIDVRTPKDVPPLRKELEDAGIACYEADIRFAYRYLIDHRLTGDVALKGAYETGVHVDRVYTEPETLPGDWHGSLTTLSIDIETDKDTGELWCVALATEDGTECLIVGKEASGAETVRSEAELLRRLNERVKEIDPDIITGWNVIDFDLDQLQDKYRSQNVQWDWSRSARTPRLRVMSDYLRDSSADVPGRMVLDGIHLLRTSFIQLDSYSLEAAAQEFLGDGKLFKGKDRYEDLKRMWEDDPDTLVAYNKKDAELVLDILDETGVLDLTIERSRITGMQLDRVKASIASLDMLYLPRLRERGCVAPSVGYTDKRTRITGGYVMESKPGVYDYVIVCDFKSLYPSIMRTLNIDPLAHRPDSELEESDDEFVVAENGAVFEKEAGILPALLQELWGMRDAATERGDSLARYAIKILMNSFFGVLASPNCRFFSLEIGNAITHTGQHVIKRTAELIRELGYEVIYGDTDSIFIDLNVSDETQAIEIGKRIESSVNDFFDEYVEKRYKTESHLEMEYERTYKKFLMPMTRSGEGSKKRYAGLIEKDGEEDIDFTGLEFVRRDWTDLAKEFQLGLLERIFHEQDPQRYIREYVKDLKAGKKDGLLVYRKAMRKKIEEYTKTTPQHVKAAKLMDEIESNIIEYVVTVDGPEPTTNQQHSIDYDHYAEKQLKPIADSVLAFYDTNFYDVLKGTEQTGLEDF